MPTDTMPVAMTATTRIATAVSVRNAAAVKPTATAATADMESDIDGTGTTLSPPL